MAINKAMQAALKALSYPELDIRKTYKLERELTNLTSKRLIHPGLYKIWDHKVPCADHEIPIRIFTPSEDLQNRPVLIFIHGGGWVTGNIDSYNGVCTDMAHLTQCTVASIDYRLAPEHRFPEGLEDCYTAVREIYRESDHLHVRKEDIVIVGDSAGGNLTAAVSLMAKERGDFTPRRQILIYPALYNNHSEASPYPSIRENGTGYLLTSKRVCDYMELYRSSPKDIENPFYAPLLAKDLSGQPKTLIITAEYCPLRDEGEDYGERLGEAGNDVEIHRIPDALHGYFSLPARFELVKKTYDIMNQFLEG